MFGYLILLFTVLPALELYVLLKVGTLIGAGNTIMIIILTGVVGAYLARLQGFLILRKIQENLAQGIVPNEQLLDGVMVLVGGIVLLTPGFITDITGILLLLPPTRAIIKIWLKHRFTVVINQNKPTDTHPFGRRFDKYDDIDLN